MVTSKEDAV